MQSWWHCWKCAHVSLSLVRMQDDVPMNRLIQTVTVQVTSICVHQDLIMLPSAYTCPHTFLHVQR